MSQPNCQDKIFSGSKRKSCYYPHLSHTTSHLKHAPEKFLLRCFKLQQEFGNIKTEAYISLIMSNILVIHPKDNSTDFLRPIYAQIPIKQKTIITGGISKSELRELIQVHERVIMLGHGTPWGLLAVGKFPKSGSYIIDDTMAAILSEKESNIYIWCNADQFVIKNHLSGFFSEMFISELSEAICYNYLDMCENTIDESNNKFSEVVSKYINQPLDSLFRNVIQEYKQLAKTNPIAQFNVEQLFFKDDKKVINSICNTISN